MTFERRTVPLRVSSSAFCDITIGWLSFLIISVCNGIRKRGLSPATWHTFTALSTTLGTRKVLRTFAFLLRAHHAGQVEDVARSCPALWQHATRGRELDVRLVCR